MPGLAAAGVHRRGYEQQGRDYAVRGAALWTRFSCCEVSGRESIRMTDDDLTQELAQELAQEHRADVEYKQATTTTLALIPVLYGILTFAYSNALWNPAGVHAAALKLYGAPQSWGAIFIVLGLLTLAGERWRLRRAMIIGATGAALIFATFMVFVLISPVFPRTLGQAVIYGGIAVLFLHRARRAWVL